MILKCLNIILNNHCHNSKELKEFQNINKHNMSYLYSYHTTLYILQKGKRFYIFYLNSLKSTFTIVKMLVFHISFITSFYIQLKQSIRIKILISNYNILFCHRTQLFQITIFEFLPYCLNQFMLIMTFITGYNQEHQFLVMAPLFERLLLCTMFK